MAKKQTVIELENAQYPQQIIFYISETEQYEITLESKNDVVLLCAQWEGL